MIKRRCNRSDEDLSKEIVVDEDEEPIAYNCLYRYGKYRVKLRYDFKDRTWKEISDGQNEKIFDCPLNDGRSDQLDLEQQIRILIKRYEAHFNGSYSNRNRQILVFVKKKKRSSSKIFFLTDQWKREGKTTLKPDDEKNNLVGISSKAGEEGSSIDEEIVHRGENDFVDSALHLLRNASRSKLSNLSAPPVAPRRSRQNSSCSVQSCVRYASWVVRLCRTVWFVVVVEDFFLRLRQSPFVDDDASFNRLFYVSDDGNYSLISLPIRFALCRRTTLETILEILKRSEPTNIEELGFEFLRIYDGRFNYREGHTVKRQVRVFILHRSGIFLLVFHDLSKESLAFDHWEDSMWVKIMMKKSL